MKSKKLLAAAKVFDLPQVAALVASGVRNNRAFLGDQGFTLPGHEPETKPVLDRLSTPLRPVHDENAALFDLYEALLLAGHPVPDGHNRHYVARVIASADSTRAESSVALMRIVAAQNGLSWTGSSYASSSIEESKASGSSSIYYEHLLPTSNSLYASAIGVAAQAGNVGVLQFLVEHPPEGVKGRRSVFVDISVPTCKAAAAGKIESLAYLFSVFPESEWLACSHHGVISNPALLVAARNGHRETVEWLLDHGVDINQVGAGNKGCALESALDGNHMEIAHMLLARGADPNVKQEGPTPLHMAMFRGQDDFVDVLLDRGASQEAVDDSGTTPLQLAAMLRDPASLKKLLRLGASDLEAQNKQGYTALGVAAAYGHQENFDLLLAAGARIDTPNKEGKVPFDFAQPHIRAMMEARLHEENTPSALSSARPPRM